MNPILSYDLLRQEHAERLAQSHRARVREAARLTRQPTENVGRPPDPRRVQARPTSLVGALSAR
ncbi:hypothetical protein HP550_15520 [Cellulomonas humilata]|uniref:Uncharacterized protein n=1 Tax=Cellulomonas humilata TaxID=144055 RepID=A0A7Y6A407_9CELL|nr:hypothetical protein [Cellulomonas humilata]NUU18663.1 hypothetical protein [Cellulomonas humilata]